MPRLAPGLVGEVATRRFFAPPPPPALAAASRERLDAAERLHLVINGRSLAAWRFGSGPQVIVSHGWGSDTAHMLPLIDALVAGGYAVIAADAPGHGQSDGSRWVSILDFADTMSGLIRQQGRVFAAVGHSLGGTAVAYLQARGLGASAVALIAPFHDPRGFFEWCLGQARLHPAAVDKARRRAERYVGVPFSGLDLEANLASTSTPALIVHDRADRRLSSRHAEDIARELGNVDLVLTEGLGHNRILRDAQVHLQIKERIDSATGPRADCFQAAVESSARLEWSDEEIDAQLRFGRR